MADGRYSYIDLGYIRNKRGIFLFHSTNPLLRETYTVKKTNAVMITFAVLLFVISILATFSPVVVLAASAPVFSTPVNLSNDPASAQDPIVQNVGNQVYVAWTERSGGIRFRESPNGGLTWVPPLSKPALKISNPGDIRNTL